MTDKKIVSQTTQGIKTTFISRAKTSIHWPLKKLIFTLPLYTFLIYSCSPSLPLIKKLMRKVCTQVLEGGEGDKGGGTTWRATPCQDTQCVFANLCSCTRGRNTLIDTLVRDTAHSCKHSSDTSVQGDLQACTHAHNHSHRRPPFKATQ